MPDKIENYILHQKNKYVAFDDVWIIMVPGSILA